MNERFDNYFIVTVVTTPCSPDPCMNSGVCYETGGSGYFCVCTSGYTGNNCQTGGYNFICMTSFYSFLNYAY